ncbi:VapC toxin family PIN domain ribonuclease [Cupriavidus respiraculi]|uniref:type II toxin-antitoxin system VapC family toxin n=1 Tax=Cupriavidus respiraculi TaxID=195930 RepID=UPI001C97F5BC|nr:VapC toxin family PIN domain ribonuclease [Cupriavidus respiraculi]MBY4947570.1 VapC toxin family PIN domain ribonuclease [Cupriavidus respiraculi]
MRVLIDTSIWVEHFKQRNEGLVALLEMDLVLTHPMVVAEIACGRPPAPRKRTLHDLGLLQECNSASMPELMAFIEREKLYGLGCGLIDLALLASTLITPDARLWTLDRRLMNLAKRFAVAYGRKTH